MQLKHIALKLLPLRRENFRFKSPAPYHWNIDHG
jgi:hypothetical protein